MINITKRAVAPESLAVEKVKANGSYGMPDVLNALLEDSHNKCYLCEDICITSINVEHFHEHRGDVDLKFDWQNLHFACAHCNNTKNDTFKGVDSNLLNCADPRCLVDYWIVYRLEEDDKLVSHAAISQNNEADVTPFQTQTANTVTLLDRIYNGTGAPVRTVEAENLMQQVHSIVVPFKEKLIQYIMSGEDDTGRMLRQSIEQSIADESPFAAFKRWILRDAGLAEKFGLRPLGGGKGV